MSDLKTKQNHTIWAMGIYMNSRVAVNLDIKLTSFTPFLESFPIHAACLSNCKIKSCPYNKTIIQKILLESKSYFKH